MRIEVGAVFGAHLDLKRRIVALLPEPRTSLTYICREREALHPPFSPRLEDIANACAQHAQTVVCVESGHEIFVGAETALSKVRLAVVRVLEAL